MTTISARKKPIQARSKATVEAILEASARVLLAPREGSFTTTRVAERAGVGIGTLYQYFPSKESLLAALLDRSMEGMERAIGASLAESDERSLEDAVTSVIDALLAHKRRQPELSSAIRSELGRIDGQRRVTASLRRVQTGLRALLERHARELPGVDLELTASVLTSAVEGTLSAAIDRAPSSVRRPELRDALVRLVLGYLRESGWQPTRADDQRRGARAIRSR